MALVCLWGKTNSVAISKVTLLQAFFFSSLLRIPSAPPYPILSLSHAHDHHVWRQAAILRSRLKSVPPWGSHQKTHGRATTNFQQAYCLLLTNTRQSISLCYNSHWSVWNSKDLNYSAVFAWQYDHPPSCMTPSVLLLLNDVRGQILQPILKHHFKLYPFWLLRGRGSCQSFPHGFSRIQCDHAIQKSGWMGKIKKHDSLSRPGAKGFVCNHSCVFAYWTFSFPPRKTQSCKKNHLFLYSVMIVPDA